MYVTEPADRFIVGGTILRYAPAAGEGWELIGERILCVGEATIEAGPLGEDWQLCFVTDRDGAWLEGSLFAEGRNEALHWLSVRLGCSLEVKLANAPPFRSRVMWPLVLLERPLFQYQVTLARRLFSRGLRRLGFPPLSAVQCVHPGTLRALGRNGGRAAAAPWS
jgi:hypothetical protein